MMTTQLPDEARLYQAILERDAAFEGTFIFAVRTTGIFCRPTCPARKPKRENVSFHTSVRAAIDAGYRPCKRCEPLQPLNAAPEWLAGLLEQVERDRTRRWNDEDLRALDLDPVRVRRWFKREHGLTFHGYQRARRLGLAHVEIQRGSDLLESGMLAGYESDSGFRESFASLFGKPPGRSRGERLTWVAPLSTELGPMVAAASDDGVSLLEFLDRRSIDAQVERLKRYVGGAFAPGKHELLEQLGTELEQYFAGTRREFEVPLHLAGSEFQEAVWNELLRIPYGESRSYGQLASSLGRPGASRAVGRANGDNRLAILVPCHRVVRAGGALSGYAGGVWRKHALLELEAQQPEA